MSSNQLTYISNYNKQNYKMYQFRVKKTDKDVIDFLDNKSKRNSYLTNLVLEDLKPEVLTIKQIKDRIKPIIKKHNIEDVYLFGSYARGEANRDSDVDIYCSSGNVGSLFQLSAFINELEEALGKKVDVVTIGSQMHEYFRKELEEDKIKIW